MNNIKFKLWDTLTKKWADRRQYYIDSDGYIRKKETEGIHLMIEIVFGINAKDKYNRDIYDGDFLVDEKYCLKHVYYSIEDFQYMVATPEGDKVPASQVDFSKHIRIGSKFENENIYNDLFKGEKNEC